MDTAFAPVKQRFLVILLLYKTDTLCSTESRPDCLLNPWYLY